MKRRSKYFQNCVTLNNFLTFMQAILLQGCHSNNVSRLCKFAFIHFNIIDQSILRSNFVTFLFIFYAFVLYLLRFLQHATDETFRFFVIVFSVLRCSFGQLTTLLKFTTSTGGKLTIASHSSIPFISIHRSCNKFGEKPRKPLCVVVTATIIDSFGTEFLITVTITSGSLFYF